MILMCTLFVLFRWWHLRLITWRPISTMAIIYIIYIMLCILCLLIVRTTENRLFFWCVDKLFNPISPMQKSIKHLVQTRSELWRGRQAHNSLIIPQLSPTVRISVLMPHVHVKKTLGTNLVTGSYYKGITLSEFISIICIEHSVVIFNCY